MRRVAVFGASGFVGATLVERLQASGGWDIKPIVHSSGNAWRVARGELPLESVDLLDKVQLRGALEGCSHLVNCSRGDDRVMLEGLASLIEAARGAGVERFVHLSSVAVYGDPPAPGSEREDGPTRPAPASYGWVKLKQDAMLMEAARRGLNSVSLCPPNISGPYSPYLLGLLAGLRRGRIRLLEAGRRPCNLVDVDNLAYAIELALSGGPADGRRIFVTDLEAANWRSVVDELWPLLPPANPAPGPISEEELAQRLKAASPARPSLVRSIKHLVSSDVREALRRDPLLARADGVMRRTVSLLGTAVEDRLRRSIEGPAPIPKESAGPALELRLTAQQLRTVVHSPASAIELLGYRPPHTFASSMQAFRTWYLGMTGLDSRFGDLYGQLYS